MAATMQYILIELFLYLYFFYLHILVRNMIRAKMNNVKFYLELSFLCCALCSFAEEEKLVGY